MTYTFKLSRRLALSWKTSLAGVSLLLLGACGSGAGDAPSTSSPSGPGDQAPAVVLSPKQATIGVGEAVEFSATRLNGAPVEVEWQASGGEITEEGIFDAAQEGIYTVRVRALGGTKWTDSATVEVGPMLAANVVTRLDLAPDVQTLTPGAKQQFRVYPKRADGGPASTAIVWSATGGTITTGGLFTAGNVNGTYKVIARAKTSPAIADSAIIYVKGGVSGATLQSLSITPQAVSISPAAKQQFSVQGKMSDGSTVVVPVTWTATGGAITSAGLYTAGPTAGTYKVIARSQTANLADTATVTIGASAPTLLSLQLTPASASVQPGKTLQFAVSGTWSDGSTKAPAVTYAATGGTISTAGLYTAGSTPGTFRVIAVAQGGTKADTSVVTVTASPPASSLQAVQLSPNPVTLAAGQTQQFTARGRMSDGSLGSVNVTFSATGGTITSSGLYTAGSTPGTYRVVAVQLGGTLADTAVVTITAAPPPPPPPPPPASGPYHEPSGFTPITHRAFNYKAQAPGDRSKPDLFPMWDDIEYRYGHIYTVADASGPLSSGSVMRFFYPAQTVASNFTYSPGVVQTFSLRNKGYKFTRLYTRYAVRLSPNFQGHPSLTNKLVFHRGYTASGKRFEPIVRFRGSGTGSLVLSVDPQGMQDNNTPIPTGPTMQRGQWYIIECLFEIGTPGASNGRVTVWLNGQQVIAVANREFAWGETGLWDEIHFDPTWGGGGGTITQDMWIDVDDAYVSGAP
ncbi:MAG: hypothetical protein ACOY71_04460 [Gemmatimonadota bacterium]